MKRIGKWFKPYMALLIAALLLLAGCQAVGGVDFNNVLKQSLKVKSAESKETIELKLLLNENASETYSEEELELYRLFANTKLELSEVKAQDEEHASVAGKLLFGESYNTSIGFKLAVSDTTLVLELEGAKQPFVLDMTEDSALFGTTAGEDEALSDESLTELSNVIVEAVGGFAIDNLPNPEKLSVTSVKEPINGVDTSLYKAQAELNGPEIWAWLKSYVDALINDREGLNEMISVVYEALKAQPEIFESMGISELESELDAPTDDEMIESFGDSVVEMLESVRDGMAQAEQEDGGSLGELFNENTYLKADIYVDKNLDIRKQNIELSFKPQGELLDSMFPLDGFVLNISSESWNINGEVKADEAAAPENAVSLDALMMGQGYEWLQQFDENSAIYDILKNKLHIGRQEVYLFADDYLPPIVTPQNVTIIPLRYTAEQLGAEVAYDGTTNKYTVTDEATGTTIVLKKGSDTVVVNGKTTKWQFPVTAVNDMLYVPARDFASALGAKLQWESYSGDGSKDMLIISREL
ncbi:copper amine oxidase N-terminal domain-containing protein [Paenibacillus thailandensis]|uniref:Copper amine oxidase N-terminal domain-containing protein n=1 Tax=Paenibacillus thailandensis TaxID=393250 RepID=A0ABW5QSS0_9BACL